MQTLPHKVDSPIRAIVTFGPPTPQMGLRAGEFYQVTIDPNMVSPGGKFIRFDQRFQDTEIHGWQRIESLTILEILGDAAPYEKTPIGYIAVDGASVEMNILE